MLAAADGVLATSRGGGRRTRRTAPGAALSGGGEWRRDLAFRRCRDGDGRIVAVQSMSAPSIGDSIGRRCWAWPGPPRRSPIDIFGPGQPARRRCRPTCCCGGPVDYADLPKILARYRVGLLPLSDEPTNSGRSPMKLYEYLAQRTQRGHRGDRPDHRPATATMCTPMPTRDPPMPPIARALADEPTGDGAAAAALMDWSQRARLVLAACAEMQLTTQSPSPARRTLLNSAMPRTTSILLGGPQLDHRDAAPGPVHRQQNRRCRPRPPNERRQPTVPRQSGRMQDGPAQIGHQAGDRGNAAIRIGRSDPDFRRRRSRGSDNMGQAGPADPDHGGELWPAGRQGSPTRRARRRWPGSRRSSPRQPGTPARTDRAMASTDRCRARSSDVADSLSTSRGWSASVRKRCPQGAGIARPDQQSGVAGEFADARQCRCDRHAAGRHAFGEHQSVGLRGRRARQHDDLV